MKRPMKHILLSAVAGLSLLSAPLAAQTVDSQEPTAEEFEAMGALFGDLFGNADPLSPEEEARLGPAMQVVIKLFPEGTYAKMMNETLTPMRESMMGGFASSPAIALTGLTGLSPSVLAEVEGDKLDAALALLDPDANARNTAMADAMFAVVSEVMADVEPAYRSGLARAYAVRFTAEELADLAAYFATPTGEKYAGESFLVFADPQVMESMNEVMPAVMQRMPGIMEVMGESAAQFDEGRTFSALDDEQRAQLADLLGVSEEALADVEPDSPPAGF